MTPWYVRYMDHVISWLQVFGLAAMPVLELRAAIPYGIFVLKLGMLETFLVALIGNFFPMFFLLKFLDPFVKFLFKHFPYLHRHVQKYFEKVHHKHSEKFDEWSGVALAIFVAVPLPGTGAWTGALLAYLFNIRKSIALPALALGILGAGIIMISLSGSLEWAWQNFG